MNTEELMRLADAYAFSAQGYNQKGLNEARAALEAALSAKQGEQALQDVSDPAPSVNAQERISELEAHNAQLLEALKRMLYDNTYYFPVGTPWGDRARAAVAAAESLK